METQMTEAKQVQKDAVIEQASTPTPLELALDSQKAIARISAIANVIDGCAKVSIQRTNPRDWVKMGDSYYLQATGAQKIRPVWGIYYRDRQVTKESNPDGSYGYIVTGKVGSKVLDQLYGEVVVEIDGGRSAADAFFTKGNRTPDPMDVRKAALANWEARAVTALLGLKNLSAEDLQRNGLNVKIITGVEYQTGAEGGGQSNEFISQAQQKRLFAIAKANGVSENQLKTYMMSNNNIASTSQIKRGEQYNSIVAWAESGGQARDAGEGE